jgi:hypothetical protein
MSAQAQTQSKSESELLEDRGHKLMLCATYIGVLAHSHPQMVPVVAGFEQFAKLHVSANFIDQNRSPSRSEIRLLETNPPMQVGMFPFCLTWFQLVTAHLHNAKIWMEQDSTGARMRDYLANRDIPSESDVAEAAKDLGDQTEYVKKAFARWQADGSPPFKLPDEPILFSVESRAPSVSTHPLDDSSACMPETTTIEVQERLRSQLGIELKTNGQWDNQTHSALRAYLKILLEREPWSSGWNAPTDTEYTGEVAGHLYRRIEDVEAELGGPQRMTENLRSLTNRLDCLKAVGVYEPTPFSGSSESSSDISGAPAPSSPTSPPPLVGNVGNGFMLSLANGFLYEFADEIGCKVPFSDTFDTCHEKAKQDVLAAQAAGGNFTAILNFIGMFFSPIGSFFAVVRARSLHKTGGSAFLLGLKYDLFESVLMAIGEISTFGTLQDPEAFLKWGLLCSVATGIWVWLWSK